MLFRLTKASDWDFEKHIKININTLEDLKLLAKKYYDPSMTTDKYAPLILYFDAPMEIPTIQIYDDYIE